MFPMGTPLAIPLGSKRSSKDPFIHGWKAGCTWEEKRVRGTQRQLTHSFGWEFLIRGSECSKMNYILIFNVSLKLTIPLNFEYKQIKVTVEEPETLSPLEIRYFPTIF